MDIKISREIEHDEIVFDESTKLFTFTDSDEDWNVKVISDEDLLKLLKEIQRLGWELVGEIRGRIIVKRTNNEVK